MATASRIRVLVVEDFEPFLRLLCSKLERNHDFQIIAEVSNGLEAVRRAEELRPDLIFLDIGLPILNGIDAARQIRPLTPESKIIFVTQESSPDVVEAAFNMGAVGYVLKTRLSSDLRPAVEAVRQGGRFVSSGFLRYPEETGQPNACRAAAD